MGMVPNFSEPFPIYPGSEIFYDTGAAMVSTSKRSTSGIGVRTGIRPEREVEKRRRWMKRHHPTKYEDLEISLCFSTMLFTHITHRVHLNGFHVSSGKQKVKEKGN